GDTLARPGWSEAGRREENRKFGLGVTTPREMVRLLELLHRGEVVSTAASKDILATMSRQQYKDSIGRRLGGLKVASKSGGLDRLRSDVGIVETPDGPIALAITVSDLPNPDWTADNPGQILIADLSRILVAGLRN
ncbi:MAG: class A beta-lactamase-related serine hydrolase, partial [Bryobacter sp.]|nr:class A beta-lactamase-related serine hydrolase [Bryobacter sp.]